MCFLEINIFNAKIRKVLDNPVGIGHLIRHHTVTFLRSESSTAREGDCQEEHPNTLPLPRKTDGDHPSALQENRCPKCQAEISDKRELATISSLLLFNPYMISKKIKSFIIALYFSFQVLN